MNLYFSVKERAVYNPDSILDFRIANCLALSSYVDLAIDAYKNAVRSLADDTTLPKASVFRIAIPRQCGYALWKRYLEITSNQPEGINLHLRHPALQMLNDAFDFTKIGYDTGQSILSKFPSSEISNEIVHVTNNLMYYFCEFVRVTNLEFARKSLKADEAFIGEYFHGFNLRSSNIYQVDTYCRACCIFKRPETGMALDQLKRLLEACKKENSLGARDFDAICDTIRQCEEKES